MKHKAKGTRAERLLASMRQELGIAARRIPFSGSLGGWLDQYRGDVQLLLPILGQLVAEVKARRDAPKVLTRWLATNDLLFIRPDRQDPLVCLPWKTWARILEALQATERRTP